MKEDRNPVMKNTEAKTRALNLDAADAICRRDAARFERIVDESGATICGREPIRAALRMLPDGCTGSVLHYATSSDESRDFSRFVCYCAIGFRAEFPPAPKQAAPTASEADNGVLSASDKQFLLSLARRAIQYALNTRMVPVQPSGSIRNAARIGSRPQMVAPDSLMMRSKRAASRRQIASAASRLSARVFASVSCGKGS